ncbi:MAG: sigma-70 family RNA polymerase sigma factor [Planctomycetes bacterium]|nr:sigma-70 family RNA polymerase sigma factor [Planctomycetota bacterium]
MGQTEGDNTQLQVLLDLAASGDDEAYGELIARASDRLLKLTRKMLRNYPHLRRWEQTDDVFQNATIRLYRSLQNLKPDSVRSFMGLATLEIRRSLIDLIRHHFGPEGAAGKHHSDVAGDSSGDGSIIKNIPAPTGEPDSLQSWALFHETVDQLPEQEREVFQLVWYGGLQQGEAASLLEVSVPTVQRRLYRGRRIIVAALQGEQPPVEES